MAIRHVNVEHHQWIRSQKPSLLVVLGNGPVYNPAFDVRFKRKVQFFGTTEVIVYQRSWLLAPFGSVAGTPSDIQRVSQAKVFGEYLEFPQAQRLNPRSTTDFYQGNADIFHSQDNYGWPPVPVPEYWSPPMLGTSVVLNTFPPYNPAPDVWLLKDQAKVFGDYQESFTGLKPLARSIQDTYVQALDPTRFTKQDKTFKDYESYWTIKQPGTANVLNFFPQYNPATDVTQLRPQAKVFDEYQISFRGQPITSNARDFFPPPYNPGIDVVAKPRAQQFMVPYDDSGWNTGQKPAYRVVLDVPPAPPPTGVVIGLQPFGGRVIFNPKLAGSDEIVPFDFISKLNDGEVILSAVVNIAVYTGVDPAVTLQTTGGITINGSIVNQKVLGGLPGVTYEVRCTANTNLGQVLILVGFLNVEPDLT